MLRPLKRLALSTSGDGSRALLAGHSCQQHRSISHQNGQCVPRAWLSTGASIFPTIARDPKTP
jgi:hypothetical protein